MVLAAWLVSLHPGALALGLQSPQTLELSRPMAVAVHPSAESGGVFDPGGTRILALVKIIDGGDVLLAAAESDGAGAPVLLSPLGGPDVRAFAWTPDGGQALYSAGPISSGNELFVVPADGSAAPLRLAPGVGGTPEDAITGFEVTDDGLWVVFAMSQSLYGVPLDASSAPVLLSGAATVTSWHAGGGRAVYHAGGHLHSVPADGSAAPIQLTTPAAPGTIQFELTPDATRAVFRRSPGLWSVPTDGSSAPLALAPGLPSFAAVQSFVVTPAGEVAVYRADANENERYELFRVPLDGSASPVQIVAVPTGGDVLTPYRVSPDGSCVVYQANAGAPIETSFFATDLDDGETDLLFAGSVREFAVTADSARVVFSRAPGSDANEVYAVPLGGGASELLTPAFAPGGEVQELRVTPDSQQVVYRADAETPGVHELFRVPIDPSGPPSATRLNPALVAEGAVEAFHVAPDSSHVVLTADAFVANEFKLVRAELAGAPAPAAFEFPLPSAVLGDAYDWAARAGRYVYTADQETDGVIELFGGPLDGSAPPVRLSGTLVAGGDVSTSPSPSFPGRGVLLTPNGARVGYLADAELDGRVEAWVVASDASTAPLKLNGPLAVGTSVGRLLMSPDATRWVYDADEQALPGRRLYAAPIGGGPTVALATLSSPAAPARFSPDSSRVVFVSGRLWSVPSAGGGAAALSQASLQIQDFQVAPTSARVAFTANASGDPSHRLYCSPLAGGSQATLSPALVAGGHVTSFAFSADGSRVLFLADAQEDEHFLLYSAHATGGAPALLHDAGSEEALAFRAAGGRVAFVLRTGPFGSTDLYRAADVDGSNAVTLLSTPHSFSLPSFAISPDGTRVVIAAEDQLRVVPSSGGTPLVLHAGDAVPFAFVAGGRRLVFSAAGSYSSVSLDGGAPLALPVPGLVGKLDFTSALRWLWLGDQDESGVAELHTGFFLRFAAAQPSQ